MIDALNVALDDLDLGEPGMRPAMLAAVSETFGYAGYFLTVRQAGRLTGLASVIEVPKLPWGRYLTSVPAGFWAADETREAALLAALRDTCRRRKLKGPFLKDMIQPLKTIESISKGSAAIKHLPGTEPELLSSYSKGARRFG